jgi:Phage tail lysozyme/N-acetylmuramoyl-L-alanine amidase
MADYQDLSGQATYQGGPVGNLSGFIFHHTGGRGTPQGVVNTLNQRGLGVQYVMDRDGTIYRTLPAGARGAHMQNSPDGSLSNANTEGMEIIANDDRDITPQQVAAARDFATGYAQQHPGIQFYGHGYVNPGHKEATEGATITNAVRAGLGAPALGAPGSPITVSSQSGPTPSGPDTRQLVFNALVKEGLTPQQALGSLWSMGGESHSTLDTNAYNPKDPGGSIGIAQWLGTRRKDLEAYAQTQGKPVNDASTQVGFLVQELRGNEKHAFDLLKQTQTPEDAARIWTKYYERPQVDNSEARIAAGKRVGSLDAQGNFVIGDKASTGSTPASSTPPSTTPASRQEDTSTPAQRFTPATPEQRFESSIGQALAGIGGGGSSGGAFNFSASRPEDPVDGPPIRLPGLSAANAPLAPDARPAQYQGVAGQLASLAAPPTLTDPETNPANLATMGLTAGAPGMTQLLGTMGTPSTFNYTDQRAVQPIPNMMRGPRFA